MPQGRNQVDYTDIRYDAMTYKFDNTTIFFDPTQQGGAAASMIGKAVTLVADDTVGLAGDGDAVEGRLELVRDDGFCTVQDEGFVTLPAGLAATVTRGLGIVGALGVAGARGYVRAVNSAVPAELAKMAGTIINTADPTLVVIELD